MFFIAYFGYFKVSVHENINIVLYNSTIFKWEIGLAQLMPILTLL